MTKLFNLIKDSGFYPNSWSVNTLSTIHKGGPKDNLDNFRGISVGSCLSKLFGSILTNRLIKTIQDYHLLAPNQIGFLQDNRASDHVFVIDTLVNNMVKKKGSNLFAAFIDLRKAYDSVNRNFLFQKLWAFGFDDTFLKILRSIYSNV